MEKMGSENILEKKIECIKEIVGNTHSHLDICHALQDSNMILDLAIHQLLHQDTFHEVRKRRDKKKENSDYIGQVETRNHNDNFDQGPKTCFDRNGLRGRSTRRGISREFGVGRGNRVDQSFSRETKSSTQPILSGMARRVYNISKVGSRGTSHYQRHSGSRNVQNSISTGNDFQPKAALKFNYSSREELLEGNASGLSKAACVYASASDPVHVPYRHFRSTMHEIDDNADGQLRNSASSSSSPSGVSTEIPLPDSINSVHGCNTENFADMNLVVHNSSPSDSKSEQLQQSIELPNLSALSLQSGNNVPNFAVTTMQQQQQQKTPLPQMYSEYQLSPFTDVPPMFDPSMVLGGYFDNPRSAHLSNESSYINMSGGSPHFPADDLIYGAQQFKPFAAGSCIGPTRYTVNATKVAGESSRLNYNDNNLHAPNPQVQSWRECSGMQSTPYLNIQGQAAHSAYMQPLTTHHPYFNQAAITHSSPVEFLGHQLGSTDAAQSRAFQQPQMNHFNWTTDF